ncbi:hypothetical protein O6H91_07G074300 [Diphasiastrum complanatum]|uniref:Uncharacterized protein n=1 Tax=Diphasiastrum complanatum TaxID=34168 RepID=A0ACC2D6P2_DIPCM|nr:hypothetical protein O6H91_07G074300 [Diphasiastrum complanatum]
MRGRTIVSGWGASLLRRVAGRCRSAKRSEDLSSSLVCAGLFAFKSVHSGSQCLMTCSEADDPSKAERGKAAAPDLCVKFSAESDPGARIKRNDKYVRSRSNRLVVSLLKQIQSANDSSQIEQILDAGASQLLGPTSWYWLPLLDELARGTKPLLALEVFNWKKKQVHEEASAKEYSKLISLAGRINVPRLAQELFDEMPARGVRRTSLIYNALIDAYGKNQCTDQALALFSEMKGSEDCQPNLVTYNTLISMFSRKQSVEQMESMHQECINAGFSPDKVTFNALIWGYMRSLNHVKMEDAYRKQIENGCQPDIITFNALMIGFSCAESVAKMEEVLDDLQKFGLQVNAMIGELMMEAYSRHEMFDKMEATLKLMIDKSVRYGSRVHSIMIESYARAGKLDCVETSIQRMFNNKNQFRSSKTLEVVITACTDQGAFDRLESILEGVKSSGWILAPSTNRILISKYAEGNMFDKLEETLRDMETPGSKQSPEILELLSDAYERAGKTAELLAIKERIQNYGSQEELASKQKLENAQGASETA